MDAASKSRPARSRSAPRRSGCSPVRLLGRAGRRAGPALRLRAPLRQGADEALRIYRQSFQGEGRPKAFVSVNVVVAKDAGTARRLSLPYQHAMAQLRPRRPIELMTVEQAERAPQPLPAEAWQAITEPWLIGEPHQVAESIFELTDRFDVDEVMIHPVAGVRRRPDGPVPGPRVRGSGAGGPAGRVLLV